MPDDSSSDGDAETDEGDPAEWWDKVYDSDDPAPWDTGEPQPAFASLAESGDLTGRVLDVRKSGTDFRNPSEREAF
jgi:hypothetical protein